MIYTIYMIYMIYNIYKGLRRRPERPPVADWRDAHNVSNTYGCREIWKLDLMPRVESALYRWRVYLV